MEGGICVRITREEVVGEEREEEKPQVQAGCHRALSGKVKNRTWYLSHRRHARYPCANTAAFKFGLLCFSANRGGSSGRRVQEGDDDRRQQRRQHGHRLEDAADQGGRGGPRQKGLGDHEAKGA